MRLQKKAITSDELMDIVTEEYDQITLQDGRKLKGKAAASEDAAFGADIQYLKTGKVSGRNSNSLVPVTTAVGRDIRVAIAGKRVVEKLDRHLKDGNCVERSSKTRRTRRLVAQRISQMNRIARGWP